MGTDASPSNEQHTPVRPGVVLGPDGKPCKPCTAFRHWKPLKEKKTDGKSGSTTGTAAMMAALAGGATTTQETPNQEQEYRRPADCPPDVEELGRATWTFLHTTAAYYPEKPTPIQRANMLALLKSIPMLYACKPCGNDFGDDMSKNPAEKWVGSRERLSWWLCERHNEVNRKLGKKEWGCGIKEMDARWKDGPEDGRCE
ncbi:FAD-dependent thiol oxidase [Pluteus cervinus]|uniref:FAD-dependent thiol oxidase n=1 Tax=Pluteus cervinus TaxID=181527 RepID=A0ACD3BBK5_9AGAR|nr:FAD-dependent thiol oxidase [Pluteus cervinus]